jgi:hypothetical protein
MPDSAASPRRQVPFAALAEIVAAFDCDPDEVTSYLDVETGTVVPVFEDARHDQEAVSAQLPDHLPSGSLDDQRAALADAIENADYLSSEPGQIEAAFLVERDSATRYVEVPRVTSSVGHQMMEAFIATVRAPTLRDRLDDAIRGRGAFRRFKDTLRREADETDRWYAFKQERLAERARRWLDSEGIDLADETA